MASANSRIAQARCVSKSRASAWAQRLRGAQHDQRAIEEEADGHRPAADRAARKDVEAAAQPGQQRGGRIGPADPAMDTRPARPHRGHELDRPGQQQQRTEREMEPDHGIGARAARDIEPGQGLVPLLRRAERDRAAIISEDEQGEGEGADPADPRQQHQRPAPRQHAGRRRDGDVAHCLHATAPQPDLPVSRRPISSAAARPARGCRPAPAPGAALRRSR